MKKILFVTGTRADYGKLKSLIKAVDVHPEFESYVFVTGMHMLNKYGYTASEVISEGHENIYLSINQHVGESHDLVLSNTIRSLSQYISLIDPDLIIIHGDRVEACAGAITGIFRNILVAHIEGGESSGSVDESIRHSISKMSHIHFVANKPSAIRLKQMGESEENIHVIGSPDFDIMLGEDLGDVEHVKEKYNIDFDEYGIFIFHTVTTEFSNFNTYSMEVLNGLLQSEKNFILIYPNNDLGSDEVINYFNNYISEDKMKNYKVFQSIPFDDFLVLLKNSKCIVGNSSAGVRQAPALGIPTINIGTRQNNRNDYISIHNIDYNGRDIENKINEIRENNIKYEKDIGFGDGKAAERFIEIIESHDFWNISLQKCFNNKE